MRVSPNQVATLQNIFFLLFHVGCSEKLGIVAVDANNIIRKRNNHNNHHHSFSDDIQQSDNDENEEIISPSMTTTTVTDAAFTATTDTTTNKNRKRRLDDPLQFFGSSPEYYRYPLHNCQGDCDYDSDCDYGLYCYQRARYESVPGCYETYQADYSTNTDYCIRHYSSGGGGSGSSGGIYWDDAPPILQCFSSHTMIHVLSIQHNKDNNDSDNDNENDNNILRISSIKNIHVGDKVLTSTGDYETIYAIDHYHSSKHTNFIQIFHENTTNNNHSKPLELTENHMLFSKGKNDDDNHNMISVAAKNVKVGDQIQTLTGPSRVTNIKRINRKGVFNVLTNSGTIVANGILASTYSAHYLGGDDETETTTMTKISHQHFFNMILKPYRCIVKSIAATGMTASKDDENERPVTIQFIANVHAYWFQIKNKTLQSFCLSLLITVVSMLNLLLFDGLLPFLIVIAIGWLWSNNKKRTKATGKTPVKN